MNTIQLDNGKYTIRINFEGQTTFFRYGEEWGAANIDLLHSKIVSAMAYRIVELEAELALLRNAK